MYLCSEKVPVSKGWNVAEIPQPKHISETTPVYLWIKGFHLGYSIPSREQKTRDKSKQQPCHKVYESLN